MTTIKINAVEQVKTFEYGLIDPSKIRQYIIKCIQGMYGSTKPTQSEIGKNLRKIKNNEVDKFCYEGYVIITVDNNGVESFYIYSGL